MMPDGRRAWRAWRDGGGLRSAQTARWLTALYLMLWAARAVS